MFHSALKEMEMHYHCLQCKCQSRDLPLMRQHPGKIENFDLELLAVLKTVICCFWVSMKMFSEASCHFSLLMHMYALEPGLLKASAQTGRETWQNLVLNMNLCPNSLISSVLLAFVIFVKPFALNCSLKNEKKIRKPSVDFVFNAIQPMHCKAYDNALVVLHLKWNGSPHLLHTVIAAKTHISLLPSWSWPDLSQSLVVKVLSCITLSHGWEVTLEECRVLNSWPLSHMVWWSLSSEIWANTGDVYV